MLLGLVQICVPGHLSNSAPAPREKRGYYGIVDNTFLTNRNQLFSKILTMIRLKAGRLRSFLLSMVANIRLVMRSDFENLPCGFTHIARLIVD